MNILKRVAAWALIFVCTCSAALAEAGEPERMRIVTTNFVCYDLARQIAGENADISLLIDPGTEVHAYEPSPADILAIGAADIFVCVGGVNDAWVDTILSGFDSETAPRTVRLIDCVTEKIESDHEHAPETEHEHAEEHVHIQYDDHIWTSPKIALQMLQCLLEALREADPENQAAYTARASEYRTELEALDKAFEETVAEAKSNTLIFADRFPFGYFVRDYHLQYMAAYASCARDMEPSPQTVLEMIYTVFNTGANAVYTIEMSSQSIAKTIADETDVQILTLHSCQNVTLDEFSAGETYVSLMWKNVAALKKGLN